MMRYHAGAAAGALSISTTQPLDMVRIRMQTLACTSGRAVAAAAATSSMPYLASAAVTPGVSVAASSGGSFQILACMMRNEGSLSPFKGMSFPLLSTALQVRKLWRTLSHWDHAVPP